MDREAKGKKVKHTGILARPGSGWLKHYESYDLSGRKIRFYQRDSSLDMNGKVSQASKESIARFLKGKDKSGENREIINKEHESGKYVTRTGHRLTFSSSPPDRLKYFREDAETYSDVDGQAPETKIKSKIPDERNGAALPSLELPVSPSVSSGSPVGSDIPNKTAASSLQGASSSVPKPAVPSKSSVAGAATSSLGGSSSSSSSLGRGPRYVSIKELEKNDGLTAAEFTKFKQEYEAFIGQEENFVYRVKVDEEGLPIATKWDEHGKPTAYALEDHPQPIKFIPEHIPSQDPSSFDEAKEEITGQIKWTTNHLSYGKEVQKIIDWVTKVKGRSLIVNTGTHGDTLGRTVVDNSKLGEYKFAEQDMLISKDNQKVAIRILSKNTKPFTSLEYPNHDIIDAWCFSARSEARLTSEMKTLRTLEATEMLKSLLPIFGINLHSSQSTGAVTMNAHSGSTVGNQIGHNHGPISQTFGATTLSAAGAPRGAGSSSSSSAPAGSTSKPTSELPAASRAAASALPLVLSSPHMLLAAPKTSGSNLSNKRKRGEAQYDDDNDSREVIKSRTDGISPKG